MVRYFDGPAAWRAWLARHHASKKELWVGFHKRATGKPSLTWPQSVDEALCHGWIDGVRKSIDGARYMIRFTPRKPSSKWSLVNVRRVAALRKLGLMTAAGEKAFAARKETGVYSYEQRNQAALSPAHLAALRANEKARTWFESQAPWYRRACIHWVTSAKQAATRERRLTILIRCSAAGRTVPPLTRPTGK
jgi:uncharacterized protein YdeI (YjbR/CyaY-like superfamily)